MPDLSNARCAPVLVPSAGVKLLPAIARFSVRGGSQVMTAAGSVLGLALSADACRSVRNGDRAALWLGPDEQLLVTPVAEGDDIGRRLAEALTGLPGSVVDIGHRQIALEVRGPHAQAVLSVGCPLDLDPGTFPVGMCTRTVLGKAAVALWRTQADTFHVEVGRSFADYVSRFLAEAGCEFAC
ncbi:MAG TPA: sarcosine oxidase subunit gamma family protein [Steroidobacteraceae bacterium]|jgi:sarcosine oxidase subunit gamma